MQTDIYDGGTSSFFQTYRWHSNSNKIPFWLWSNTKHLYFRCFFGLRFWVGIYLWVTPQNSDLKSRLDVSHYISGSITAYADTCPIGLTVVVTGNDTTQMAGMTSRYTIGFVLNRASDSGVVILFSYSNNEIYMISKNETWDSKVSAK